MFMETPCDRKAEFDCEHYTDRRLLYFCHIGKHSSVGKQAGEYSVDVR
jgi:hypothetical protein